MGKCNLLKPLSSNNGNFFMFSQYSEDLTIEYTQKDTARVVPSKFIALNLNTYGLNNNTIAEIFQNYYENHCCYWRGQEGYEKSHSWELLLQTLEKFNMISVQGETSPNIKYIGDINIYSNQEVDGMAYNEIYCYIPNDAKTQRWEITNNTKPSKQSEEKIPEYIQGFDANDLQDSSTDKYYNELSLNPCKPNESVNSIVPIDYFQLRYNHLLDFENHIDINLDQEDPDSKQFEINTIIVLYDIKNGDKSVHSNLPMGIYFTGMITNGVINNPITKYVSNAESYDQGTSYGLRICTRYLSQVNIETLQENIKIDTTIFDGIYPENVTVLLSKLNESQLLMSDALNKTVENAENLKNHYNLFKTSKTNVPYIQNVNGEPYWFVNGKNTDVQVLDKSLIENIEVTSITSGDLNETTINRCLKNGESVKTVSDSRYLDFNQLNNFAKSINSEFLSKNQGVTKEELTPLVTKEYVDNNFVKQDNTVNTDDFLTKKEAEDTYIPLSSQRSFVTSDKLDLKADKSELSTINLRKADVNHNHSYISYSNIITTCAGSMTNDILPKICDQDGIYQDGIYNFKPVGEITDIILNEYNEYMDWDSSSFQHIIINDSFNTDSYDIDELKFNYLYSNVIPEYIAVKTLLTIKIMTLYHDGNPYKYKILTITI